ncbi:MAG TPA: archaellin/type IV pilin N-terminal domain-containing protein [Candidatus Nanoarchaeia archaeon]|nr:archaellin/type IV pilin N-terminal domain-containing protein [Candidatus Nanoarchaeia archaeon]
MKETRAISPLVATVILIGLVVVIGSLLWFFLGRTIDDIIEKEGAKCNAQQAAEIDYTLTRCTPCTPGICAPGQETLLVIKNTGRTRITGFRVKIADGTTQTIDPDLLPAEEKTIIVRSASADGDEIRLFPVIIKEGKVITCSEKLLEAECET